MTSTLLILIYVVLLVLSGVGLLLKSWVWNAVGVVVGLFLLVLTIARVHVP